MIEILVVCTGNTCRSPMAEALLAAELGTRGVPAAVRSAGTLPWPGGASEGARAVMRERGLDLGAHLSRPLDAGMIRRADLVLAMTRVHVWTVTNHAPDAAARTYLPGELVRLGRAVGPRRGGEPVDAWLSRVAARRGDPRVPGHPHDEVPDPAGEPIAVYRATAERLARDLARVADLLAGTPISSSDRRDRGR